MKNALVFDIDGTLYSHRTHDVDPELIDQLTRLKEDGYVLGLATSRSRNEMDHLPESFRNFPFDFTILDGGARVLDGRGTELESHPIDPSIIRKLEEYCDRNGILWRYSGRNQDYFARTPDKAARALMRHFYLASPPVRKWKQDESFNLLLWTDEIDDELASLLRELSVVGYTGALELRASGVSKGAALNHLRKQGWFDRVTCFGDGENDVDLFEASDWAICPRDASKAALQKADQVVGSLEEKGIITYLKELES